MIHSRSATFLPTSSQQHALCLIEEDALCLHLQDDQDLQLVPIPTDACVPTITVNYKFLSSKPDFVFRRIVRNYNKMIVKGKGQEPLDKDHRAPQHHPKFLSNHFCASLDA